MKLRKFYWPLILASWCIGLASAVDDHGPASDWPNLARYRSENAALAAIDNRRVVFMGDSITEGWSRVAPELFSNKSYVNRGISGQTTPQMLIRFRPDVIDLKPKVVVILAGTNDIAGNTGPMTVETIAGNIASMAELAKAQGIKVILASVLPADHYDWRPGIKPAAQIAALNKRIREYAVSNDVAYLDYYSAMVDERMGMKREYSQDGVHPNAAGYKVMVPLAEQAIASALARK
ncbi:MAG: SGNH/GDSL hydrolase family protein [Proteobacteria bacterium]|nr:SGNH/GDSL hydrolase family protein [Pseudomonadota bacterium]